MEIRRVAQVSANWVDLIHIQKAAIYKQKKNNNIKILKKMYGSKWICRACKPFFVSCLL